MTPQQKVRHNIAAAAIRLGPMRRHFYAVAGWTPEPSRLARKYSLDLRTIEAHTGVFAVSVCKFFGGNSGESLFQFDGDGVPSVVIEALNADGHWVMDLISWPIERPEAFATAIRECDLLGAWNAIGRGGRPLYLHATPFDWLRSGCQGSVVINHRFGGYWLNKAGGPFFVDTVELGRNVRDMLGPFASRHEILVRAKGGQAA